MAKETKSEITETTSDRFERIKAALAADKKVSAEDQHWIEDFDAKQDVINTALLEGRHIEEMREVIDGKTYVTWVEYIPVPGAEMNVSIRKGYDVITPGPSSDVVIRTVNYFEPGNPFPKGTLTSLISNGQERITGITGFGPGGEYAGVKIGDLRPSPFPTHGPAGVKPSSWDPGDGSLGKASGGTSADPSMVDPLQNDIDAFVNSALNAPLPGAPGGSSQSGSSDTSGGSTQSGSNDAAGLGSPGFRGEGASVDTGPGAGDAGGGGEQGDPSSAQEGSDSDAGASGDPGGGGDEQGDPSSAQTNDQPPDSEPAQQNSDTEDVGFTVEGELEHVENVNTGQVGAQYESGAVEVVGGKMGGVEGHWQSTDDEYHAAEDYYSAGSAPIPAPGSGGSVQKISSGSGGSSSGGSTMSWEEYQAYMAATWSDPNWNPEGAPIDYGDDADPTRDPVIPKSDEMVKQDEVTPRILVDPSFYEESTTGSTTKLEMANALENTGNPLEENQAVLLSGSMPSTSEQENVGGDAMAATNPDLVGSVEQDDPDDDGPGAIGSGPGGDDLP